jgi:hypothetical protein
MKHSSAILALGLMATLATGCEESAGIAASAGNDLEIPLATRVGWVKGDAVLAQAGASLTGQATEPTPVPRDLGYGEGSVTAIEMTAFEITVTEDAFSGPDDDDDLRFVSAVDLFVRSTAPDSRLKDTLVASYRAAGAPDDDPYTLALEVEDDFDWAPFTEEGFELYTVVEGKVPADDVSFEGFALFLAVPVE